MVFVLSNKTTVVNSAWESQTLTLFFVDFCMRSLSPCTTFFEMRNSRALSRKRNICVYLNNLKKKKLYFVCSLFYNIYCVLSITKEKMYEETSWNKKIGEKVCLKVEFLYNTREILLYMRKACSCVYFNRKEENYTMSRRFLFIIIF